ncbi:class E sortase [Methanobacterium alcaliphilum]|uniref:class E sortase n=1 Tax=Methanobacterium alcaliphilum TaxID=392018 RepID=UPI00200B2197|nr:class E sortase [Methanobacterium alcaliphilum]MCK9150392.1 class E sortase [Methanobacterium alcaliphilum]
MRISTIFIILGMLIISMYCLIDVSYYASQVSVTEHYNTSNTPLVNIPSIDVTEKINNKSVFYGVYHEPESKKPNKGTVIIFGHRTMYGSPFMELDKLKVGQKIYLEWPGIGKAEYVVSKTFIVPASYRISIKQGKKLFLITCHPLGSSRQRLIVESNLTKISPLSEQVYKDNPQNYYALLIIVGFLLSGLVLTYFYPVQEDKIILLSAVIGCTLFLVLGYLFPIPPDFISSQLSTINNLLGI